ncbi:hypothetical protein PISL3812_08408 [Talaromyces islandicus]|uniref:Zn(2)-C6 fungal-type domain-containing protein n=1 Tax=Talaromyces islandicus TaxID=28573 RepID=A0A0U1M8S4_TALIS|nr:hypothetical protein PISL3812_08408 [Talaromyces islandicus]
MKLGPGMEIVPFMYIQRPDMFRTSCQRCLSTGRKCDGYENIEPDTSSSSPQNLRITASSANSSHTLLSTPSAHHLLPGNEAENQHFDFFRSVTTTNLASFLDIGFWSNSVLQATHQYPALFHATAAFGCIHHSFLIDGTPATVPREDTNGNAQFSLGQFNKAIRSMSQLLSQDEYNPLDQQVILTTCILFTCICVLQGRQDKAFMHVNNGLKMIRQWRLNDRSRRESHSKGGGIDALMLAFMRLDTQIRPYIDGQESILQWTSDEVIPAPSNFPFKSLLEAYTDLETIFNRVMRVVLGQGGLDSRQSFSPEEEMQRLRDQSVAWDNQLSAFLADSAVPRKEADESALNLVRLRRAFMNHFLDPKLLLDDPDNELIPIYQEMLQLVAKFLQHEECDETPSLGLVDGATRKQRPQHPVFTLATGVIEPLFVIGTRCRDPALRRKALHLLQLYPRREGVCEGMLAEKIVRMVVDIEENNCLRSIGYRESRSSSSTTTTSFTSSPPPPSPSLASDTLSMFGYSYPDSAVSITSTSSASPADKINIHSLSPCSEEGQMVCNRHRVVKIQFLLLTERQLKIVMWTAEDLQLKKRGRVMVSSWW